MATDTGEHALHQQLLQWLPAWLTWMYAMASLPLLAMVACWAPCVSSGLSIWYTAPLAKVRRVSCESL